MWTNVLLPLNPPPRKTKVNEIWKSVHRWWDRIGVWTPVFCKSLRLFLPALRYCTPWGLPWRLSGKESTCQSKRHRDTGSTPGSGRSSGGGNGSPLQYSCLGNPMARGAWRATVLEVTRVGHNLATRQKLKPNSSKLASYVAPQPCAPQEVKA